MSKTEAEVLIKWGRFWCGKMWIGGDTGARDKLISHVNDELNDIGYKLSRGWQPYDPVIRRIGAKPESYASIVQWARSHDDSGRAVAQQFLDWAEGDDTMLDDLPVALQGLAIITHLAEVGRGYSSSLAGLYAWLADIVAGNASWLDYRERYPPSLKYVEDIATEWSS